MLTSAQNVSETNSSDWLDAMLVAYGDDSADSKRATVFAAAAVLGTPEQWSRFKSQWEKRIGDIPFHATDCESGWGDYRGVDRQQRTSLYRDLVCMLAESELFGFATAMNIQDFVKGYPGSHPKEEPYYLCFAEVAARCAGLGYVSVPAQQVDITFDQNFERDPSIADLYEYLGSLDDWPFHERLGKTSFANYRKESGIQVADLVAREVMKHMENTMLASRERWSRHSFVKLNANPRSCNIVSVI